jgi:hypothetical protein
MNMVMSYIGSTMMCYGFHVIPNANYNVVPKIVQLWWGHLKKAPRLQVLFANQVCVMNKMWKRPSSLVENGSNHLPTRELPTR